MKLNNEEWVPEPGRPPPIPNLPPDGYTYLIDGATGHYVKRLPPGKCLCRTCFPERFEP